LFATQFAGCRQRNRKYRKKINPLFHRAGIGPNFSSYLMKAGALINGMKDIRSGPGLLLLLFWLSIYSCGGQSSDGNLAIEWKPMREVNRALPEGIRVYEGHSTQIPLQAWYVRVREADPQITTRVVVSTDDDRRETAAEFAQRTGACIVINGGYFRMDLIPARHVGLLKADNTLIEHPTSSVVRDGMRFPVARAALGFTTEGQIDVAWIVGEGQTLFELTKPQQNRPGVPDSTFDAQTGTPWLVQDAIAAGPCLIANGEIHITDTAEVFFGTSIPKVHPRTAAGYLRDGDLILLVVDGRQDESRGVDLKELAVIMKQLGCVEALNLDGGGSSTMVVNNELLNRPAGGTVQREVMSALAVFYEE
jgi:exopolysaccharide biosynthesis protein